MIKRYIFLSGAKSNDPFHIDYAPDVFKFTKIPAKRTQESLKRYERAQKRQRRPNVKMSKTFTAQNICNDSRMELGKHNDKDTQIIKLFSLFYNLPKFISSLSFIIFLLFKVLIANLDRKCFDF